MPRSAFSKVRLSGVWLLLVCFCWCATLHSDDQLRLRDICRLKGQEENKLQGIGLVVGLKGTGDSDIKPTTRALARMIQNLGGNIAANAQGIPDIEELEGTANTALVLVSATIPASGAIQGERLDCTVSAISAKSLEGGRLMLAYMLGPRADVPTVYAIADGQIHLPSPGTPTSGVIHGGCKMESTIRNSFVQGGMITLVIDRDIASFSVATDVQDAINGSSQAGLTGGTSAQDIARAIDPIHIEVNVPDAYRDEPVQFVSLLLDIALPNIKKPKRVVINEREGVIVMSEDILINPVAINHKNLSIEARNAGGGFVGFDPTPGNQPKPKLESLVKALQKLNVPTSDVIAIIKTLKRNGDLYGEVVVH